MLDWHLPVGHLVMPPLFNELTVGNPCVLVCLEKEQHGLVIDNNWMNNSKWRKQAKLVTRHEGNTGHVNKSLDHAEDKKHPRFCFLFLLLILSF